MVISSFISSILILALGIWAYMRLEASMNLFAEKQLLIEPSKFSFKMWKDMPVSMYQSFTFFNLTNWNQVKAIGQKPRFVEVGPYVYKTVWSKADVQFFDDDKQVSFAERKQWHFQAHLSSGSEEDLIWTINTPLMTALVLMQNAPVITRNIVSLILDGLGEGAFIRRPIRALLFEGYSDLIVSVGPLFDRRFANFNGKFAYLYNKNDTLDGHWTVSTGRDDVSQLNKISHFRSAIVNMSSQQGASYAPPQGLNEVKPECAQAWSLDQSTNGQLFAPFNRDSEQLKLEHQLQQMRARSLQRNGEQQRDHHHHHHHNQQQQQQPAAAAQPMGRASIESSIVQAPKRFFSRISGGAQAQHAGAPAHTQAATAALNQQHHLQSVQDKLEHVRDLSKFIFYPDLCRPLHLLPAKQLVTSDNGLEAARYYIDPRVFMNSSQVPSNKCFEMNPRPALANALAATISSVTGANVNVASLAPSGSSPFALFVPPSGHQAPFSGLFSGAAPNQHNQVEQPQYSLGAGLFERSNSPASSFLNNALHSLSATANQAADQLAASASSNQNSLGTGGGLATGRLGRVRQLFSNIVSQRMSGASPLLPSLSAGPSSLLAGSASHAHGHGHHLLLSPLVGLQTQARNSGEQPSGNQLGQQSQPSRQAANTSSQLDELALTAAQASQGPLPMQPLDKQAGPLQVGPLQPPASASDRWITQFRFKWPRGVFSIGQCQLGAPIYVSLPHFLDADEYYLEQVDGLKPNRSLHEFYIDVESTLHSVPVSARARLQLNVATPELRFRNIPNAMIPVLWQEVTFKIDKPVATLLYWSFTMSGTIYTAVAVALIFAGLALLVVSLVSTLRRQTSLSSGGAVGLRRSSELGGSCAHDSDRLSCSGSSRCTADSWQCAHNLAPARKQQQQQQQRSLQAAGPAPSDCGLQATEDEGQRSSWQHVLLGCSSSAAQHKRVEMRLGGPQTNGAFSGSELALNNNNNTCDKRQTNWANQRRRSPPKQPNEWPRDWSRASSHCELVSSRGLLVTPPGQLDENNGDGGASVPAGIRLATNSQCSANCLLTCIKHSPGCVAAGACGAHSAYAVAAAAQAQAVAAAASTVTSGGDVNTIVRQKQQQQRQRQQQPLESLATTTSDIDTKTTLSSIRSGSSNSVGSYSSIIHHGTQRSRTFHKSSRATR